MMNECIDCGPLHLLREDLVEEKTHFLFSVTCFDEIAMIWVT